MNLHLLRMFLTVVEQQSFSRAAEALFVSQSAVSKGVRELEHQLSLPLLERGPGLRGIRLTEAGTALLEHARGIFALERRASEDVRSRVELRQGQLRIGASTTVAGYWLPAALAAFVQRYPDIRTSLAVGNTDDMANALIDGRADIAFVEGRVDHPGIVASIWRQEELRLVVAAAAPLGQTRRPSAAQLAAQTWLIREPGSGTRQVAQAFLDGHGIVPARSAEFASNEAIARAVAAGAGVAILPALLVKDMIDGMRLRALAVGREAPLSRPLYRLELATRARSPALAAFLAMKPMQ